MNWDRISGAHNRDFFPLCAPSGSVARALGSAWPSRHGQVPGQALVFDLQHRDDGPREIRLDGQVVCVIPFGHAIKALVELALDPALDPALNDDTAIADFCVHLPRRPFNKAAQDHGAERITDLALTAGFAIGDDVFTHLSACLALALTRANPSSGQMVDELVIALTLHIAQHYGGMVVPLAPSSGGLLPWQLQRARAEFEAHLDGTVSLADVAADCGLSLSHLSREFTRSTGVSPHRWMTQRRIEIARDLILSGEMPLAEVAIACGFADQSHLTRAFAGAVGKTPGRWRKSRLQ